MKFTQLTLKIAIAIACPLVSISLAHAADTSDGCGVGWMITQRTSLSATSTRGTTNGFLPNTFSMTSGTSGCAKHPIVKKDEPAFEYVRNNYDTLKIALAEGRGEDLNTLAYVMGCRGDAVDAFGGTMQGNYRTIVGEGNPSVTDLFDHLKDQVAKDPVLSSSCG